ncbi:sulfurtransferase TusA family protein [Acidianus brierleyi]|nr:sulfurtransferase TusA family protein [Acidianus brierleyi]
MQTKLDLTGLCCSVPQMLVYSKLKKMNRGDILEIIVEKGSSQEADVVRVLNYFGCSSERTERGEVSIYIIRR